MAEKDKKYDESWTAICTGNTHHLLDPDIFLGKVDPRNPEDIQKAVKPVTHAYLSEADWLSETTK